MLKTIAIVVLLLLGAVLILAALKPDYFRVQRATSIKAPPEKIYPYVNEFDRWGAWSPYEKRDPAMKRTRSGPASGKGAVYAWEGNSQVGSGRMEITESAAPSNVVIKLDFLKPFEAHNTAEFTIKPNGDGSEVTWAMHGPANYVSKLIGVFVSMDRMVGPDFEVGLANLKSLAER